MGNKQLHLSEVIRFMRSASRILLLIAILSSTTTVWSQESSQPPTETNVPIAPEPTAPKESTVSQITLFGDNPNDINFFDLLVKGGSFMIPLLFFSIVTVTFTIERAIGLRRSRVLPNGLVTALGQIGTTSNSFDPKKAYKICQQYPSAAANVVRAMLLKVGRPHSEVEQAAQETSQRESERLYSGVRWLNLSSAVSPLIGLLGTVWGMIIAFHDLTILTPDQNKAEFLARGIYIALVTTLGGLMVAIPAAVAAHIFEGRLTGLFHQIDELVISMLPQVERYEGRMRFGKHSDNGEGDTLSEPIAPPPAPEKVGASK